MRSVINVSSSKCDVYNIYGLFLFCFNLPFLLNMISHGLTSQTDEIDFRTFYTKYASFF